MNQDEKFGIYNNLDYNAENLRDFVKEYDEYLQEENEAIQNIISKIEGVERKIEFGEGCTLSSNKHKDIFPLKEKLLMCADFNTLMKNSNEIVGNSIRVNHDKENVTLSVGSGEEIGCELKNCNLLLDTNFNLDNVNENDFQKLANEGKVPELFHPHFEKLRQIDKNFNMDENLRQIEFQVKSLRGRYPIDWDPIKHQVSFIAGVRGDLMVTLQTSDINGISIFNVLQSGIPIDLTGFKEPSSFAPLSEWIEELMDYLVIAHPSICLA